MNYLKAIKKYQNEIMFLSFQSVKKQYLETAFGLGWAVVKPMVYVLTFWLFFSIGLRGGTPVDGHVFILFLFAGIMPWFLLAESVAGGTKVITKNAILVKTIKFPVMALPLIEVLAKMYVHIAVMFLVSFVFAFNGEPPTIYYINFIYYWTMMVLFLTSITFFLSSVSVLLKDIQNLVSAIMQPLLWSTPVLWYQPGVVDFLEKLFNPFYFFIAGYRETLLYQKFFWEDPLYDIYMWIIIAVTFAIGLRFWKKLRPIMADIL